MPSAGDVRKEITRSGMVNREANTSATADAGSECSLKNNHAHTRAADTLRVREINQTSWWVFERRLATIQVAVMSRAKLYGQMRPITMLGGCHAGFGSVRYHC